MSYSQIDPTGLQNGLAEESGQLQFQLAPLSTGQILDRTFVLYRSRFGLFAGLAVFPAAVSLLFGLVQVVYLLATHTPLGSQGVQPFSAAHIVSSSIGLLGGLAKMCIYGISIAASAWCIARIYLGEPATMKTGFEFAFRHWFRYIVLALAQAWFAMWLPVLVGSVAIGATAGLMGAKILPSPLAILMFVVEGIGFVVWLAINSIRVSLAISACVVEELPIRAAIRRSRALLVTRKVRVFLLFLFMIALGLVFSVVIFIVAAVGARSGSSGLLMVQLVTLAIAFVSNVLISPIAGIALCLFYFDERVRREGFDIDFLLQRAAPMAASSEPEPGGELGQ